MRRAYLAAGLVAAAAVALSVAGPGTSSAKNDVVKKEAGKSATAELLPVAQVVLFSSGVGYFQREGTIEGDQRVDLSFPQQDVNDLIKSLTLRDHDGGRVGAVSYDSNVPVERTLQSYAVNLTRNPSFGDLLNQARGEKVEVVLQQAAAQPGTLTGSVIGVEKKKVQVGKETVEAECLNLWCADGMRSVRLAEVQRVRFLSALMESEFKKALDTLALGHDAQKKTVSIHFSGNGKRRVSVGYVVENPVWKTSYRLVLAKQQAARVGGKPGPQSLTSAGPFLTGARGEKVEVALRLPRRGQTPTLTGTVLGVEKQKQGSKEEPAEYLNLWCASGSEVVRLADVRSLRFLNPALQARFRKALGNQGAEDKPYLQGWAVVENTTDEDWSGVRMALISGRPISFQMNLYDALFIKRPVVEPELFASLLPPSYSGDLDQLTNELKMLKLRRERQLSLYSRGASSPEDLREIDEQIRWLSQRIRG